MILQLLPLGLTVSDALQILVSVLIAGLYYLTLQNQRRQSAIQEKQNQIMQWQTRLMAAEYEPDLHAKDFSANGNTAELTLSNVGQGRATNLSLKCLMFYKHEGEYSTAFSNQVLGSIITPKDLLLTRLGRREEFIAGKEAINTKTDNDSLRNSLGAHEEEIVFHADVELEIESINPVMDVSFTRAVEHMMNKWDADTIGFDFYVFYKDVVDQEFPLRVASVKAVEAEEGLSLSDALENGKRVDSAVSTFVPDAGKPQDIRILEEQ